MTPGILNVSAAARSLPPSSKATKAGRTAKARTTMTTRSQTGGGGMIVTQPSGRLARARAERKSSSSSATLSVDPSTTTIIKNTTSTTPPPPPAPAPAPTTLPRMPKKFPPSNPTNSSRFHQGSNPRRRPHNKGAKYPRRFELELYDERHLREQGLDHDFDMEISSDERALSSGEEQTTKAPVTPPAMIPLSSSFPLDNAFPSFLTPPHTPARPTISHSRSLSHTLRTPSTPFTPPPLTHHASSSTSASSFSFPSTPPIASSLSSSSPSILSSRYANSTFQHSPSPNVLPKPRFLDNVVEGLPEPSTIPSASQLQMLFGDSLMFDVEMEN